MRMKISRSRECVQKTLFNLIFKVNSNYLLEIKVKFFGLLRNDYELKTNKKFSSKVGVIRIVKFFKDK